MSDWRDDYWSEALEAALNDVGATLPKEQFEAVAGALATSAEYQSMCTGPVENPLKSEVDRLGNAVKAAHDEGDKRVERVTATKNEIIRELRIRLDETRAELREARRQ